MQLAYASHFQSAEANVLWAAGDIRWLAGFRYVELNETFNMRVFNGEINGPDPAPSDYTINTSNHLYGGQFGVRWIGGAGAWGWQTDLKGGVLANAAFEHQVLLDRASTVLRRDATATGCNLAGLGELNLSLTYQISPRWTILLGYNVLYLEGLALGPEQVDFSLAAPGGTTLHNDAGILVHGANAGLLLLW
jgi:hypothetical protein